MWTEALKRKPSIGMNNTLEDSRHREVLYIDSETTGYPTISRLVYQGARRNPFRIRTRFQANNTNARLIVLI